MTAPLLLSALLLLAFPGQSTPSPASAPIRTAASDPHFEPGVYAGNMLCGDCSAIATRIVFKATPRSHGTSGTYTETQINADAPYTTPGGTYIPATVGRSDGQWKILPGAPGHPDTLRLTYQAGGRSYQEEYHVARSQIIALDGDGNELPAYYPRSLVRMVRYQDGHEYPDVPTAPFQHAAAKN